MRIMITGGGTGGHTSPAVAIIEELRRRDPQLMLQWVGRRASIEQRVSAANYIPFRTVPVEGWPRKLTVRRAWVLLKLAAAIARAALLLRKFRPSVVVGVGGYVSLPLLWAAQRMGVNTVIHEQNKRLGMANRLAAPRAKRIFLSYEDTIGAYPKETARVVGNPVRAAFITPPSIEDARAALALDPAVPVVLVAGGSQGAQSLNQAMHQALPGFRTDEVQFIWITGKSGLEKARQTASQVPAHVQVAAFIEDMPTACAAADLIVSRAGASSTAEIAALGKPAILVPYPHATDNHQLQNAQAFEEAGAAILLLDDDCSGEQFDQTVRGRLADPQALADMGQAARRLAKPLAADVIAEEIIAIAFET